MAYFIGMWQKLITPINKLEELKYDFCFSKNLCSANFFLRLLNSVSILFFQISQPCMIIFVEKFYTLILFIYFKHKLDCIMNDKYYLSTEENNGKWGG